MGAGALVKGNGSESRAGTRVLNLLATPISGLVLRTLADGPKRLVDLRRECGSPAQTTLRAYLKELEGANAIERRRGSDFPGVLECELTGAGKQLLGVVDAVEHWLEAAPDGPIPFGSPHAKAAIKALSEGWSSTLLRALAARPLSLTELDVVISGLSYPSLERRLAAMKLARQIEPSPSNGKGTPYTPTPWLRRGVGPVVAAARWERRHLVEEAPPFDKLDIETAFLLTMPLLQLSTDVAGSCRMAMEVPNGSKPSLAGVLVHGTAGRISSCTTRLEGYPQAWVSGSTSAWLAALVEADLDRLEMGGDCRLVRSLIDGLHETLFAGAPSSLSY